MATYRDDTHMLRQELAALEKDLAERVAEKQRLDARQAELPRLSNDIAALRQRLFERDNRARSPRLDNVRIASPCQASWDDMVGDERQRHCAQCNKGVFNIAGMTKLEAEALLDDAVERRQSVCLRIYRRADGTVMTSDCLVGVRAKRRRLAIFGAATMAGGAASLVGFGLTATTGEVAVGTMAVEDYQMGAAPVEAPPAQPNNQLPNDLADDPDLLKPVEVDDEPLPAPGDQGR